MSTGGSQLATCLGMPGSKNRRCSCSARAINATASFHIQSLGSPNISSSASECGQARQRQREPAREVPIEARSRRITDGSHSRLCDELAFYANRQCLTENWRGKYCPWWAKNYPLV